MVDVFGGVGSAVNTIRMLSILPESEIHRTVEKAWAMGNAFIVFGRQRTEPDYGACQGALRQYKKGENISRAVETARLDIFP